MTRRSIKRRSTRRRNRRPRSNLTSNVRIISGVINKKDSGWTTLSVEQTIGNFTNVVILGNAIANEVFAQTNSTKCPIKVNSVTITGGNITDAAEGDPSILGRVSASFMDVTHLYYDSTAYPSTTLFTDDTVPTGAISYKMSQPDEHASGSMHSTYLRLVNPRWNRKDIRTDGTGPRGHRYVLNIKSESTVPVGALTLTWSVSIMIGPVVKSTALKAINDHPYKVSDITSEL